MDADLDHRAWDLGSLEAGLLPSPSNVVDANGNAIPNHPTKGPMVTLSLRGLANHNAFHWRGDKPTLQDFNEVFENLLGGAQLADSQIDDMAGSLETLVYAPNPFYSRDARLAAPNALTGAVHYLENCQACHALEHDGALRLAGFEDDA